MATEVDHIVAETAGRIFADLADPQTVNVAPDGLWKEALWRALTEAGLPLAWVPEAQGGAGASIAEGFEILGAAGRFALSVPLAETLLAGWLLERGGIKSPAGVMTVAPVRGRDRIALNADGTLSGSAGSIPFAAEAAHLAILAIGLAGPTIALVNAADCDIGEGRNLAGEPANTVRFDRVKPVADARAPDGFDATTLLLMGATVRSVEIAGALETVLSMSVRYANERVAFERPIGKFQAVQQNLARLAGETAAALAAAGSAADTIAHAKMFDDTVMLEAASAKIRAGEAAAEGSAIAHQVHGAIGFTDEHVLHRFTLRMLAWRDDFGGESHWAATLGRMVARGGSQQFWPMLASR
ncbi:MAG: acyl-CoA/acyl-ACP dehydrogenase [Bradyrhizobiaceae bacterium]|nr:acyl-CoA/acyl-ACP dehydrogenase [Bradyrhizobiaceae bacterium]